MKVKFVPQDVEVEADSSTSVLEIAKKAGLQIKSVCGGTPSCAECKVQIATGEYNVLPPSDKEISLIGTAHFVDHSRLSCQLRCFGDVTIDLNEQVEKQNSGAYAKKPRGKAQKAEGEESHAVEGSILLGGVDLDMFGASTQVGIDRTNERRAVEVFDEDETKRALEQIRRKRERDSKRGKSEDGDDEYLKKLKNRNQKYQSYGEKDDDEEGGQDSKKSSKHKKSSSGRNRNHNNKDRKKSGGPTGQKKSQNASGKEAKASGAQKPKRKNNNQRRKKQNENKTKRD